MVKAFSEHERRQSSGIDFTQDYSYLADQDKILLARSSDGDRDRDGNGDLRLYLDGQGIDEHLGEVSARHSEAFEVDHLGSVLNSEAAGSVHAFGAYGESLGSESRFGRDEDPVMYGFTGRELSRESGEYYDFQGQSFPESDSE